MTVLGRIESGIAAEFGRLEKLAGRPLYPIHWYLVEVDPGKLWRCSWPKSAEHLAGLKAMGVEVVVNLCDERSQDDAVRAAGMEPVNIPIVDNTVPTEEQAGQFLAIKKRKAVHCEQGEGRTGCMVAAYRVLVNGWKPEDALAEAERFGLRLDSQKQYILGLGAKKERERQ